MEMVIRILSGKDNNKIYLEKYEKSLQVLYLAKNHYLLSTAEYVSVLVNRIRLLISSGRFSFLEMHQLSMKQLYSLGSLSSLHCNIFKWKCIYIFIIR